MFHLNGPPVAQKDHHEVAPHQAVDPDRPRGIQPTRPCRYVPAATHVGRCTSSGKMQRELAQRRAGRSAPCQPLAHHSHTPCASLE